MELCVELVVKMGDIVLKIFSQSKALYEIFIDFTRGVKNEKFI